MSESRTLTSKDILLALEETKYEILELENIVINDLLEFNNLKLSMRSTFPAPKENSSTSSALVVDMGT